MPKMCIRYNKYSTYLFTSKSSILFTFYLPNAIHIQHNPFMNCNTHKQNITINIINNIILFPSFVYFINTIHFKNFLLFSISLSFLLLRYLSDQSIGIHFSTNTNACDWKNGKFLLANLDI